MSSSISSKYYEHNTIFTSDEDDHGKDTCSAADISDDENMVVREGWRLKKPLQALVVDALQLPLCPW